MLGAWIAQLALRGVLTWRGKERLGCNWRTEFEIVMEEMCACMCGCREGLTWRWGLG